MCVVDEGGVGSGSGESKTSGSQPKTPTAARPPLGEVNIGRMGWGLLRNVAVSLALLLYLQHSFRSSLDLLRPGGVYGYNGRFGRSSVRWYRSIVLT